MAAIWWIRPASPGGGRWAGGAPATRQRRHQSPEPSLGGLLTRRLTPAGRHRRHRRRGEACAPRPVARRRRPAASPAPRVAAPGSTEYGVSLLPTAAARRSLRRAVTGWLRASQRMLHPYTRRRREMAAGHLPHKGPGAGGTRTPRSALTVPCSRPPAGQRAPQVQRATSSSCLPPAARARRLQN